MDKISVAAEPVVGSQFRDYDDGGGDYDDTRVAVGVPQILSLMQSGPGRQGGQVVLDAGCGTGNYIAALAPQLGTIYGLDFSPAQLAKANAKLACRTNRDSARTALVRGDILAPPFAGGEFDAVLLNQVLHHLCRS